MDPILDLYLKKDGFRASQKQSKSAEKTALNLKDIPKNLLVVGGGVIGLELGQVYASLGSEVSVVEFLPSLIPGADQDVVKPLQRQLSKQFKSIQKIHNCSAMQTNYA